jgi:hypothetical protein
MSPEAHEIVSKREQEVHQRISQMGQRLKSVEPTVRTLTQYQHVFDRHQASFDQGIAGLLQVQELLDTDSTAALKHIAKLYGRDITFNDLPDDYDNPIVQQERQRAQRLQQENRALKQRQLEWAQHQQRVAHQNNLNLIEQFAKDKPDFAKIEDKVLTQLAAVKAENPRLSARQCLEQAYKQARALTPEGQREAAEKALKEEQDRADAARKAADLNVGDDADEEVDDGKWSEEREDAILRKSFRRASKRRAA